MDFNLYGMTHGHIDMPKIKRNCINSLTLENICWSNSDKFYGSRFQIAKYKKNSSVRFLTNDNSTCINYKKFVNECNRKFKDKYIIIE